MPATRIVVGIPGESSYDVRIGSGLLRGIGQYCRSVSRIADCQQMLVLSDSNVASLYLSDVKGSLMNAGYKVSDITVPAGEVSKSIAIAEEIWEAMAQLGLSRDCCVVALGGGVAGDLAGFVASTFMRGLPVVQVPTTLLSMVDSSVGGKTGINLSAGKNLVGTFMQPTYVCASIDTLSTLPAREWACGLGEVAKSAVIDGDDFFFWLMDNAKTLAARDSLAGENSPVAEAIQRCVVFKARVVSEDKCESKGIRECLNYGHTLAHAIEKLAGYGVYSHGAAVAEGMRFAAFMGERITGTSHEFTQAQATLLDELGLPRLDWHAPASEIVSVMKRDKKVRGGKLKFVLVRDVGDWELTEVSDADVLSSLDAYYGWCNTGPS